jgi:hypothetical protein
MPFPAIEQFEAVVSSLSLVQPDRSDSSQSFVVSPETRSITHTGESQVEPSVILWARDHPKLRADACVRKVREELAQLQHASNDSIAISVLALYAHLAKSRGGGVTLLNRILHLIVSADVSHYLVFWPVDWTWITKWKDCHWGLLEADRLKYRCEKAGSDYFQLYGGELKGRGAFESPVYERQVIDWKQLFSELGVLSGRLTRNLLLNYFNHVSRFHFEQMVDDIDSKQQLLTPFGLDVVDVKSLIRTPATQRVSVYFRIEGQTRWGYVVPEGYGFNINWLRPDAGRLQSVSAFESRYALESMPDSELNSVLKAVARCAHLGRRWFEQGLLSDALVNYVISLEILFSDKEAVTSSVCSRTAVVAHRGIGKPYAELRKEVDDLYKVRSKYVHKGKAASTDDCVRLETLVREVILCLLRLQMNPEARVDGFLAKWIKRIDWIKSALDADVPVESQTFSENGIA